MNQAFSERLSARMQKVGSRLCVGIDPVVQRFPEELAKLDVEEALVRFSEEVLDAVSSEAACVKPQAAFFERHGWRGVRALERTVEAAARRSIPVILDAKRGDIGSTAQAYADAYLGETGMGQFVDALTVNPYLGSDSLAPFLELADRNGRGLFVLARTSNPGGAEFQTFRDEHGPLFEGVARAAEGWNQSRLANGYGPVGLVAGATFPEELTKIRELAPSSVLLLPGIGAQGGKVKDILAAFDSSGFGAVVSSSRGIIYAYEGQTGDWRQAIHDAAADTRGTLESSLAT